MSNIQIVFTSPELQKALSRLNINLIDPSTSSKLLAIAAPSDLAFSMVLDEVVRQSIHFSDISLSGCSHDIWSGLKQEAVFLHHIQPMIRSNEVKEQVINYLNQEIVYSNIVGEQPAYKVSALNEALVIGVEPGFFKTLSNKEAVKLFYKECLEVCQLKFSGETVVHSNLFNKFVKLSISF